MVKNYLDPQKRQRIDSLLENLLLNVHKSYPEDSLLEIVQDAIPGVQILEDSFESDPTVRGVIFQKSKEFKTPTIVLRKSLSPEVKTFTLAHELGHYLLDHPGSKKYLVDKINYDGSNRAQIEVEAQYFAASLLMPKDKFKWLCQVLDEAALAKRFGVTVAAVRVRKSWLKSL